MRNLLFSTIFLICLKLQESNYIFNYGMLLKLSSCKSALNLPVVYSTARSKAVVLVLVLLFIALWFILWGDLCFALCYFVLVFFSPLSIAITSHGEERSYLSAFRMFVRFALVSYAWCLGRASACDYGSPLTFLLPILFLDLFFLNSASLICRGMDIWKYFRVPWTSRFRQSTVLNNFPVESSPFVC